MGTGGSSVSGRETIVTLVGCALVGFEAVANLLILVFIILLGMVWLPYLLFSAVGLMAGLVLGIVLLRQGGISIPSRQERAATRGALVGLVVGVVVVLLTSAPPVGMLGLFGLVGLAIGRTFDRSSIHPTA